MPVRPERIQSTRTPTALVAVVAAVTLLLPVGAAPVDGVTTKAPVDKSPATVPPIAAPEVVSSSAALTIDGSCGLVVAKVDADVSNPRLVALGNGAALLIVFDQTDGVERMVVLDEELRPASPALEGVTVASSSEFVDRVVSLADGGAIVDVGSFGDPRPEGHHLVRVDAGGRVDADFADGGTLFLAPLTDSGGLRSVFTAGLADGRLVTARSAPDGVLVERWTTRGEPDGTFGTDGGVLVDDRGGGARGVAVLPDGDLVVAFGTGSGSAGSRVALLRPTGERRDEVGGGTGELRNADSLLLGATRVDDTLVLFGGGADGAVTTVTRAPIDGSPATADSPPIRGATANGLRLSADGTALLVGAEASGRLRMQSARLRRDGTLDTTHGIDGIGTHQVTELRLPRVRATAATREGEAIGIGIGEGWDTGHEVLVAVRMTANGALPAGRGWCPEGDAPADTVVRRLGGATRYETAVAAVREGFPDGADHVMIATGANFPDALAGGPAASALGAALVLVPRAGPLPVPVADELERLAPTTVTVLGGPTAVSQEVADEIGRRTSTTPTRIAGRDRYATAAATARLAFPARAARVYVTTGQNFPDALSAAAVAGGDGAPLVLVRPTSIPADTADLLEQLAPDEIIVVGGRAAVSDAVFDQLRDAVGPDGSIDRAAGRDRIDTGARLVQRHRSERDGHEGRPLATIFLATARDFPDALAAGALAGAAGGAVLLVQGDELDARILHLIGRAHPRHLYLLGGSNAVSPVWEDELRLDGATSVTFLSEPTGRDPVAWDPCTPIQWVLSEVSLPAGGETLARQAVERLAAASGYEFVYEGITDEEASRDRALVQEDRYGRRWVPLIVGWGPTGIGDGLGGADAVGATYVTGGAVVSQQLGAGDGFTTASAGEVLLHELGHAMGLGHSGDRSSLMWWQGNPDADEQDEDFGAEERLGFSWLRASGCREVPSATAFAGS